MSTVTADVEKSIATFLGRIDKMPADLHRDLLLYGGGIGLDSLETAELSASLEDDHGSDPFAEGLLPETVGEILDFYQTNS